MPTTSIALAILLLLVVPGFLTRTIVSSSIPRQQRSPQEWVAEVAGFGAVSAILFVIVFAIAGGIAGAPAPSLSNFVPTQLPFLAIALLYIVFGFIIPILIGFIFVAQIQHGRLQALYRALGVQYHHPAPRAWDWYFSKGEQRGVVVTLIDGSQIAGFSGQRSFASSFPANEDLFLECVYEMADGKITGNLMPRSAGVWIQGSQIRLIEFYTPVALGAEEKGVADNGGQSTEQA